MEFHSFCFVVELVLHEYCMRGHDGFNRVSDILCCCK